MKQDQLTFTVTITGTNACEWQGTVRTEDGAAQPFRSAMELLSAMNEALQSASFSGAALKR